ncbi:PleD family two-component system response regulator [Candidatus Latescibacterota bacterium]
MFSRRKILVVDDDIEIVELITLILETSGYEIISADSGHKCLRLVEIERPDLIILDIMMETMTEGFNIGYKIKNNSEYKSIPIIFMSSISKQTGFPIDTDFINCNEFLEKPINPDDLLERINNML